LSRFFRPEPPRQRTKRERGEPKKKRTWIVMWPAVCGYDQGATTFQAHTKSEARGLAKAARGIKGRLPIGVRVTEKANV